jgi:hypothetical protein
MNRFAVLVMLLFAAYSMALSAQESPRNQKSRRIFTAADGTFRFSYSRALVPCHINPNQTNFWEPDACNGYLPVCYVSGDSSGTVACVAYPADKMKGTNFEAAAFSVSELKKLGTRAECMKIDEPPPHGAVKNETVNGITFKVAETDGVAAGNVGDGQVYRTFHHGKCYQLDIRIATSNIGNYPPGTVKSFDLRQVQRALKEVVASFTFLR